MLIIDTRLGLELKKRNKKSVIYEIGKYNVKIADGAYSARSHVNEGYIDSDGAYGELEYYDELYLTNRITEKTRQTRVYQDIDVLLRQIEDDFNENMNQFPWPQ